ncbi:MAG TPA: heparan-alpha-glucosaminide N-acetyltransferase domain-containing protein [Ignavibacteriaceae bacterium]|nr:heparan-alpha-glucosaminide N-acetyltransferase domain-containing protein [Ignavibacteriaceae bacterium]
MTQSSKKNRIIFIDLMRAFAVLQMVQGHTVDVLLASDYRTMDSPFFAAWFFMRGMTAPIFMFTYGIVFTYLFRLVNEPFNKNPRTIKGFKRFFLLVGLGYLLRYPTATVIDFSEVTDLQMKTFLAVDVLQLIGVGILFILIFAWLAEKLKISDYLSFSSGAVIFFGLSVFFESINWSNFLPVPLAGYFYYGTGSLFPAFPWAGYLLSGAVLGSYLAKHPLVFKTGKFSKKLAVFGIAFLSCALIIELLSKIAYSKEFTWISKYAIILLRVGFVLLLNSLVSFIALKIQTIPRFLILIGRNTLLIYIVHLIILYGSAWNPGLSQLFAYSFNVWKTIGTVLLMLLAMAAMVLLIHKFKIRDREVVT